MFKTFKKVSFYTIFIGQKYIENANIVNLASFWKAVAYDQTVSNSVTRHANFKIGQSLIENAKIKKKIQMPYIW